MSHSLSISIYDFLKKNMMTKMNITLDILKYYGSILSVVSNLLLAIVVIAIVSSKQ